MTTVQPDRRVHISLKRLLPWAAAVALLLGAAKTLAIGTVTEEVLVLASWIVIVGLIRTAIDWRVAAVSSATTWMVLGACLVFAPDLRRQESTPVLMIVGCVTGCILGLIYYALSELLCRAIGWVDKLLYRPGPTSGYEANRMRVAPKRHFQFSVSMLLVVVVLAALPMGWLRMVASTAQRENRIVAEYMDFAPYVSRSLFLGKVTLVWFGVGGALPVDADLSHLEGLTSLSTLILASSDVTDNTLRSLETLSQLATLVVHSPSISDAKMMHFRSLTNLSSLDLSDTNITDAGLLHLRGLTNLQELRLEQTNVTDAGLEHLNRLAHLRWLDVSRTEVTASGARKFQQAMPHTRVVGGRVAPVLEPGERSSGRFWPTKRGHSTLIRTEGRKTGQVRD